MLLKSISWSKIDVHEFLGGKEKLEYIELKFVVYFQLLKERHEAKIILNLRLFSIY